MFGVGRGRQGGKSCQTHWLEDARGLLADAHPSGDKPPSASSRALTGNRSQLFRAALLRAHARALPAAPSFSPASAAWFTHRVVLVLGPRSQSHFVITWVRCGGHVTLVRVKEPATRLVLLGGLWLQVPEATHGPALGEDVRRPPFPPPPVRFQHPCARGSCRPLC